MPPKKNKGKLAIYPGTFDPITNGHLSLIDRAVHLFDNLTVAVSKNAGKAPLFSHDERFELVKKSINNRKNIEVIKFDGLLADLAQKLGATAIVRGLRAVSDFEYEFQMALMNRKLIHDVETVFLMPSLSWVYLSSTIVKDVAANHGEIKGLVPSVVAQALMKKVKEMKV
ncbi:Phosphopantetheine adenylyltransferase [Candidatus Zixiibacteriota bacterium]|nr:Phosphopantetheine adenylyltransferase [candidate division Zixibacteria bacterium]